MNRYPLAIFVYLATFGFQPCAGQVADRIEGGNEPDAKPVAAIPDRPRLVELTVSPTKEPIPAFRYSFLPNPIRRESGNAAQDYLQAFAALQDVPEANRNRLNEYLDASSERIFRDISDSDFGDFNVIRSLLFSAIHKTHCDWESELTPDAVFPIFPLREVNRCRELERYLVMRARFEVSRQNYDEAVEVLRLGYSLSRDLSKAKSIVASLVSVACCAMLNEATTDFIKAPDSPSLYWAIAEMPRPFISARPALMAEVEAPFYFYPFLLDAEEVMRSGDEWKRGFEQASANIKEVDSELGNLEKMLTRVENGFGRARKKLIEQGYEAAKLDSMAPEQVVAIYQARVTRHAIDEFKKVCVAPFHQLSNTRLQQNAGQLEVELNEASILPVIFMGMGSVQAVRTAETRAWGELNGLQTLEAIRLYSLQKNEPPPSLDDCMVPIPLNPHNQKAFTYRRFKDKGVLTIPTEPAAAGIRYVIKIRK